MTGVDPDRLDQTQLEALCRELAGMSDAALAWTYEFYRIACGLREDGDPARGNHAAFLAGLGRVSPTFGAVPFRLIRLTNAFSKRWENHWAALCLHFAYYSFCRIHRSIRVTPANAGRHHGSRVGYCGIAVLGFVVCSDLRSPSSRMANAWTSPSTERKGVPLATCAHRKTEATEFCEYGVPVCHKCANIRAEIRPHRP
jgi:hypothetical protein